VEHFFLQLETWAVERGIEHAKILFIQPDIQATNCEKSDVKPTHSTVYSI